ncbi:response regulator [Dongia deserti]|uniref:response regulator n=1 Tax=Dongia deserti TaxID=2268030 RepID=UPI0013C51DFE|nr:response regulator [Dongia deserti]
MHEPAVVVNQQTQVVSVNVLFEELICQSQEIVVGRHLLKAAPALDVPRFREFLRRLATGEIESHRDRIEVTYPNGESEVLSVRGHNLASGAMGGVLLITIGKPQRYLGADASDGSELGARAIATTLANHEIRQPLQTISLLQGLMLMDAKGSRLEQWISRIGDALGALTGTLDALACMNEIERRTIEPVLAGYEMNSVLDRLRPLLAYYAEANGLEWYIASSHALIRTDARLLEQLLRVLILSAMKLLRSGTVLIGCRPRQRTLRVEIWVSGKCVGEHEQRAILDDFRTDVGQVDRTMIRSFAKPLARMLDVSLWARSHPGPGLAIAAEVPLQTERTTSTPHGEADADFKNANMTAVVLIISDAPSTRDMMDTLIKGFGHRTVTVSSAGAHLIAPQKDATRLDLVVADLPNRNDEECLRFICSLRNGLDAPPPAIVFSDTEATRPACNAMSGPIVYLRRPVDADELRLSIARLLTSESQTRHQAIGRSRHQEADPSSAQTIYVVEDDHILRETLQRLLHGKNAKFFAGCEDFLAQYDPSHSGCIILDNVMTGMRGVELLEHLAAQGSRMPAVMITGHADVPTAVRAMKSGAIDFIQKPVAYDVLLAAIQRALDIDRQDPERHTYRESLSAQIAVLTARERQVMDYVVYGLSNKAIAHRLGISRRTVENHRASVMRKMGATSLPDLMRMLLELSPEEAEDGN